MPTAAGPPEQHRRTRRLETGWRFHRGDVDGGADPSLDDGSRPMEWWVPYEPGTLRAVAKEDGDVVAEHELHTVFIRSGVKRSVEEAADERKDLRLFDLSDIVAVLESGTNQ